MFVEVPLCEAERIDRVNNRLQQADQFMGKLLQILVEWMVEHVVIDVSHKVDQALLLRAFGGVVGSIKVGDKDAGEA
jgi:hypothetical protein